MDSIQRQSLTFARELLAKAKAKAAPDDDQICLYPSKKCTNLRAKKKNGELHTMCEYHRIRANENQRRLERRRKAALRFPHRHAPKPTLWNRPILEPLPLPLPLPEPEALAPTNYPDLFTPWQPIEIEILMTCLFDTVEIVPSSAYHWPVLVPTPINRTTPRVNPIHAAQFV
jgi:hypothetical protein